MALPPPFRASSPCELCHSPAHVLCPSDAALLCWRCDSMVHGANFLVARHPRTYLCNSCACPTTVVASGAILRFRSEVCLNCSFDSAEDCCSSGSVISDSECSMLTSESDEESVPSCRSQKFTTSLSSKRKQALKYDMKVHDLSLDTSDDQYLSDGMSGVEDGVFSSDGCATVCPFSDIRKDNQENAEIHGRQGRSFHCNSSQA